MRRFAALCFALLCGCAVEGGEPIMDDSSVSYEADIKPLLDRHCVSCHDSRASVFVRLGAPTDVNFDSYEATVARRRGGESVAARANVRVQARTMPPPGLLGASSLDESDRKRFDAWIAKGHPRAK